MGGIHIGVTILKWVFFFFFVRVFDILVYSCVYNIFLCDINITCVCVKNIIVCLCMRVYAYLSMTYFFKCVFFCLCVSLRIYVYVTYFCAYICKILHFCTWVYVCHLCVCACVHI